ncbi:hypothetical protein ACNTMW_19095 [Planosporangium sp. 12N6]|uniref:hypothetical protein n=1 Tax=Planosporangium spinosum TaxID=3402278 RepID=UPI003CEA04F1
MNSHDQRRIDRRTAEHLLAGEPMGLRDSHPPLQALLTAATVPGRPDELAGEQATLDAFRTARRTPIPRPRRFSSVRTTVAKALTVKVVAALAVTTAGGVALAAGTGTLPNPLAPPAPVGRAGLAAASPSVTRPAGATGHSSPKAARSVQASASPSAKVPTPALLGLCRAYHAGNKAERGKALDTPAFSGLLAAAGGRELVDRFCQAALATPTPSLSDDPRDRIRERTRERPREGSAAQPSPTRSR